ncbi:MAG: carboxymuconolactone decarboxylase family protein [Burkholderiales bacterium]
MPKDYEQITRGVSASLRGFRKSKPDFMGAFDAMADAALRDGALDKTTKELIALALGVAGHCDACIGFHVRTLVRLGASRDAIEEALGVAVYMGGGPSLMYAADALAAYEQMTAPAPG